MHTIYKIYKGRCMIINLEKIPTVKPRSGDCFFNGIWDTDILVNPYDYSNRKILCDNTYYKQGIRGAISCCLVRKGVMEQLLRALNLLPSGCTFMIFDAWRPYNVQYSLYYNYFSSLADSMMYEDSSIHDLREITNQFVSLPERNLDISYVHSSGGAIDLTIVDSSGIPLDMGSPFDDFTINSNTDYYEIHADNQAICNNRRILYYAMTQCGFTNLPTEWWHYDYGDKFWSYYTGQSVKYQSIYYLPNDLESEVNIHG